MASSNAAKFVVKDLVVINESRSANGVPISTGIGYLDHMIDQLNSHAQVGIGLRVVVENGDDNEDSMPELMHDVDHVNRFASGYDTTSLLRTVGTAVGAKLKECVPKRNGDDQTETRFCCPLDEALVECVISDKDYGSLDVYTLAPFGMYPKDVGRTHIGQLPTADLKVFWTALAESAGWSLCLRKIRGNNAHHICESSFKAFARALRRYGDVADVFDGSDANPNQVESRNLNRIGTVQRKTKETTISIELKLSSGSDDSSKIDTGLPFLDQFFVALARAADMQLSIHCRGDVWVDDHHTAEDVGIAVGQCLAQALGTKAGLNRMWVADEAGVEVTMDLSNRPCLFHDLHDVLSQQEYVDGDTSPSYRRMSCEMMEHVLESLVMNARMTVHIVGGTGAGTAQEALLSTASAFGRALRVCATVDCRRAGQTASSKGTLSV